MKKINRFVQKHRTTIIWTGLSVGATALLGVAIARKIEAGGVIQRVDVYKHTDSSIDELILVIWRATGKSETITVPSV